MSDAVLSRVVLQLPGDVDGVSADYVRHQAVMSLFRDAPDARPLYRVLESDGRRERLMMLSRQPAIATSSIAPGRWVESVESKPYAPRLQPDRPIDFDVEVNAAAIVTSPEGRKRRVDVWDVVFAQDGGGDSSRDAVYIDWLRRQLGDGVAELDGAVAARSMVRLRPSRRAASITFVRTRLIGRLVPADPGILVTRIGEGIGRARAFGCGLVCLLPAGFHHHRR